MAKQWPEYMGTYKGMVMESELGETRNGFAQFIVRVLLTEYYDVKDHEWLACDDNQWTVNGYFSLYGREGGREDGKIVETMNHQQVCSVFGWDGVGFDYLLNEDFQGKVVQVRIEESTMENAKAPCQVCWLADENADPSSSLRKLDADKVKELEKKFAHLWKDKKPVAKAASPKKSKPVDEEPTEVDAKEAKKKALLAKSKRLLNEASKGKANSPKKKASPPPKSKAKKEKSAAPDDYDKTGAWNDVCENKSDECEEEMLVSSWEAAIAELAEDGDEDNLDSTGWQAVKEQVLSEVGQF